MRRTKRIWGWLLIRDHLGGAFKCFYFHCWQKWSNLTCAYFSDGLVGWLKPPPGRKIWNLGCLVVFLRISRIWGWFLLIGHQFVGRFLQLDDCKACARMLILLLVRETRKTCKGGVMWFDPAEVSWWRNRSFNNASGHFLGGYHEAKKHKDVDGFFCWCILYIGLWTVDSWKVLHSGRQIDSKVFLFECRMCIAVCLCIHMFVICVSVKSIIVTVNRTGTIYQHFANLTWLPIHENLSMPRRC